MNPKRILTKETVILELKGSNKEQVIEELVDVLVKAGKVRDRKAALKAVMEREKKMSTGLQNGIAIPHGKMESLESLIAAFGMKKQGVPFDSLDGQPSHIFVMTLSPTSRTGPHIQFLADISRTLHDPAVRQKALNAQDEEEVLGLLSGEQAQPLA